MERKSYEMCEDFIFVMFCCEAETLCKPKIKDGTITVTKEKSKPINAKG